MTKKVRKKRTLIYVPVRAYTDSGRFKHDQTQGWVGNTDLGQYPPCDISGMPKDVREGVYKFQIHPDIVTHNDQGYPIIRENTKLFRPDSRWYDLDIFDWISSTAPSWRHKIILQPGGYVNDLWFADTTYVEEPFPHYYTYLTAQQLADLVCTINHLTRDIPRDCFMTATGYVHSIVRNGQPVNIWYTQMEPRYFAYVDGEWEMADFKYPGYYNLYFGFLPFKAILPPYVPPEDPPVFDLWSFILSMVWPFMPDTVVGDPRDAEKQGKVPIPYLWFDFDGSKTGKPRFYIGFWEASGSPPPVTITISPKGEIQPPVPTEAPEKSAPSEQSSPTSNIRTIVWSTDNGETFGPIRNKHAYRMGQVLDYQSIRELTGSHYSLPTGITGKAIDYQKVDRLHGYVIIEVNEQE